MGMKFTLPIVAIFWLALPSTSAACSCAGVPTLKERYNASPHIFVGKLVKIELVELLPAPDGSHYVKDQAVATFDVIETIKGYPSLVKVTADGTRRDSCSGYLDIGSEYLIFGKYDGRAHVGGCLPSSRLTYRAKKIMLPNLRDIHKRATSNIPLEENSEAAPQLGR